MLWLMLINFSILGAKLHLESMQHPISYKKEPVK